MFWDSSALVPLLVPETRSRALADVMRLDRQVALWWGTIVECHSAIHRRRRVSERGEKELERAISRLTELSEDSDTVAPSEEIRRRAISLLSIHDLSAADALQLSAAIAWGEGRGAGESFVCLDDRLAAAARLEGFVVRP